MRLRRASGSGTWAVIAGGGTGGHVVPAIAIRTGAGGSGPPGRIHHFRRLEARHGSAGWCPAAGFRAMLLPGRGMARRLTWDNVAAVVGLLRCSRPGRQPWWPACGPSVVISVGGYASFACARWRPSCGGFHSSWPSRTPLRAWRTGCSGRFASACAVSFPGTPLPRAVLTGNPVRAEILAVDRSCRSRAAARAELGLPSVGMVVAVAGGSLGARRINDAVLGLASIWSRRSGSPFTTWLATGTSNHSRPERRPCRPGGSSTIRSASRTGWTWS